MHTPPRLDDPTPVSASRWRCALAAVPTAGYALLVAACLGGILTALPADLAETLGEKRFGETLQRTLIACSAAAAAAWLVGTLSGYFLARARFPGKGLLELLFEAPLVIPPVALGAGLLLFLITPAGQTLERAFGANAMVIAGAGSNLLYDLPALVLAQFLVAAAIAARVARTTFAGTDSSSHPHSRAERVRLGRGLAAGAVLAWVRSLGEFGPVLILADAIAEKTTVLTTGVLVHVRSGDFAVAAAASLVLVLLSLSALIAARACGLHRVPL
ncbi:MAG: hypothetical protein KY476_02815 [Planctomycetes bacterium]|nr:hypothetical protein [Planctomycetota bacterium]